MKGWYSRRKKQQGVFAIEFAMGILLFLMMIFYWMEVSYMGFVSSVVDYAVAESSRGARTVPSDDYRKEFKSILDDSNSGWASFVDAERFTLKVSYFKDIQSLDCDESKKECDGETSPLNNPLAIYRVSYPYQPLFASLFFEDIGTMTISREVITVQEYERELFK